MGKKLIFILTILWLISPLYCVKANTTIDSLEQVLKQTSGQKRMNILNDLSWEYLLVNPEMGLECGFKALKLSEQEDNHEQKHEALYIIGRNYIKLNDYVSAMKYLKRSLEIAKKNDVTEQLGRSFGAIGLVYLKTGDFGLGLDAYLQYLKIMLKLDNTEEVAFAYNNIATTYFRLGDFENSLHYMLKSLEIKEKLGDKENIASVMNNLGNLYVRLKNVDKALEYFKRSLKIAKENENKSDIARVLTNMGNAYLQEKNYDRSLYYYKRAYSIKKDLNESSIGIVLNNIGGVYNGLGNNEKALEYFSKALAIKKKLHDKHGIANCLKNVAMSNIQLGNPTKAIPMLKESLELAKKINAKMVIQQNYKHFTSAYELLGEYELALKYHRLKVKVYSEIINEKSSAKMAEYQSNYNMKKSKNEIELLRKNNEIYELKIERNKLMNFRLYMIVISIILISLFIFYLYYSKKRRNERLRKINKQLDERVHDQTSRLQESNLSLNKEINHREKIQRNLIKSLQEKEVMLREIHHRVKNNLQVITSILDLQADEIEDDGLALLFKNTQNRIQSMSLIHERLYATEDFSCVNLNSYIDSLVMNLFTNYQISSEKIEPIIDIEDISIAINVAIPCGMIVNELVTNSILYAFPNNEKGSIKIILECKEDNVLKLEVSNNGTKFPDDVNIEDPITIGLQLVKLLSEQINASFKYDTKKGIKYTFEFENK